MFPDKFESPLFLSHLLSYTHSLGLFYLIKYNMNEQMCLPEIIWSISIFSFVIISSILISLIVISPVIISPVIMLSILIFIALVASVFNSPSIPIILIVLSIFVFVSLSYLIVLVSFNESFFLVFLIYNFL